MSDRTVIAVGGADREAFLQGLVTNDVTKASGGLVYAALLTPQGKYLADFFLLGEADRILIDVDAALAAGLMQRLAMYRLRAKVTLDATDIAVSRGTGPAPQGALADPRHPALGWRAYGVALPGDSTDWDALRVAHLVPQTGVELTPETYILEAGFDRLHGVDFRKGCYVGQEVTARMKHKTTLRKGLARVSVDGPAETGATIEAEGKPVGTLLTRAGDTAIAYLRLDRAADELSAGSTRLRQI